MNTGAVRAASNVKPFTSTNNKANEEAAFWVARLSSDRVSTSDRIAFSNWLNQSESNIKAFDEMEATLVAMEHFSANAKADISAITSNATATPLSTEFSRDDRNPSNEEVHPNKHSVNRLLNLLSPPIFAVAAILLTVNALFPSLLQFSSPSVEFNQYTTQAGEKRELQLPDGSSVLLNTKSHIEIAYTSDERKIHLHSGEAFFDVASNPSRPFVVDIGRGSVRAVGTAFNIHVTNASSKVTVTEGTVEVKERQDATTPYPDKTLVKMDQEVSINSRGLTRVTPSHTDTSIAWMSDLIVFDNEPLSDALSELNRYMDQSIDYSHPSLKHVHVSGTFSLSSPEKTLQALMTTFDLRVKSSSSGRYLYKEVK
ncbi:FecR family protein [Marinibactrum halimedae]|uniref:DUF4880 domain-containing protein n=1 Tax=Marinibactrum halimedae TaxID=1444977 RepID=A0AA37T1V5_9GAMM|nr:FecR domain-containing protein [Marinibactrum halimedae]MCD9457389.1 FecR domain-containing protein [Marinibactrum halimedae]GLS25560.1 hypothetical protein GCM10007877_12740 [Marinibactrum halimedae]